MANGRYGKLAKAVLTITQSELSAREIWEHARVNGLLPADSKWPEDPWKYIGAALSRDAAVIVRRRGLENSYLLKTISRAWGDILAQADVLERQGRYRIVLAMAYSRPGPSTSTRHSR